jgi:D-alanyl-D-alanine carboxypeptidase (penicillin-binding protein 5/6)
MKRFYLFTLKILIIGLMPIQLLFAEESFIPEPPSVNAQYFILKDAVSGRILAEQGADERVAPASITKIMTGYVVADQIDKGFISADEEVFISENCWRKGGSKMFIKEGSRVLVSDLIKGMVIQSGNDASCALAEHTAGSEEGFVDLMMVYVRDLGLDNTNFVNVWGGTDSEHYSTARDLALLSQKLIEKFPDHYSIYKEKYFTFNNIKQRNRNSLLWQDDSIDGMKTGHTESAGYCLVSSGVRNDTRLIAVTLKSSSEKRRLTDNRRLLDYGFRYFRTKKILSVNKSIKVEEVWGGEQETISLESAKDVYITLSPRDFKRIEPVVELDDYLQAPLSKGQVVGRITLSLDGEVLKSVELISSENVEALGFFGRAWSNVKLLTYRFLTDEET